MPYRLSLYMRDNNDKESAFSVNFSDDTNIATVDAFLSSIYAPVLAISNAQLLGAKYVMTYKYNNTPSAVPGASSYDRLILLCRNELRYGSVTIPAPAPFPYLLTGPYRGFKVDTSQLAMVQAIQTFVNRLAETVLPDGSPFPVDEWVAALMVPPL